MRRHNKEFLLDVIVDAFCLLSIIGIIVAAAYFTGVSMRAE